ncbi:MAG: anti-sigma factor family protein [Armatimonadota bacterium]
MNTCKNQIANIMDYMDGSLSGVQRELFEAHLCECASCRQSLLTIQQGLAAAKAVLPYTPAHSASDKVKTAVRRAALRQRMVWPRRVAFAGACACIVTISMLVWHPYAQQNTQVSINKLLTEDHVSWQNSEAFSDPALAEIRAAERL